MQISETPTDYILVKARTDSEWDSCDFAIVNLSNAWRQNQLKRLDTVEPFVDDYTFQSLNFYDCAVDFYQESDASLPDVNEFLANRSWAFVDVSEEEQDTLTQPENALDGYTISIKSNGEAKYKAYGKHTGEEFWTEEFPLSDILKKMTMPTNNEKNYDRAEDPISPRP